MHFGDRTPDSTLIELRRLSGCCQNGFPPNAVDVDVFLLKEPASQWEHGQMNRAGIL